MKTPFKSLLLCAALISFGAAAQDEPGVKIETKTKVTVGETDPVKSELEKATEAMVANIATALKAFKDVDKPDTEKVQEFDRIINQIRDANALVAEDGDLYKEVRETVNRQLEKQKKWEGKARDPETPADRREVYKKLARDEAANAKKIANMLVILIDIQEELDQKIFDTAKDKEFYIDMIEAEQVKKASEVLDKVALSMNDVIKELDKLSSPEMQGLVDKKPVDNK